MAAELDFEQAMQKLEQIVQKLEQGNLSLEDSLKMFEEGIRLSRLCTKRLEEAEKKIEILLKGPQGEKKLQPFELTQQELFEDQENNHP